MERLSFESIESLSLESVGEPLSRPFSLSLHTADGAQATLPRLASFGICRSRTHRVAHASDCKRRQQLATRSHACRP